jgi:hypothetical protein
MSFLDGWHMSVNSVKIPDWMLGYRLGRSSGFGDGVSFGEGNHYGLGFGEGFPITQSDGIGNGNGEAWGDLSRKGSVLTLLWMLHPHE